MPEERELLPQYQRRCIRQEGLIPFTYSFKHNFVPRYEWVIDWEEILRSGLDLNAAYRESAISSLVETIGREVYVRDICTRCGMTVERLKDSLPGNFFGEEKIPKQQE